MNYLAHLHLSQQSPKLMVGNFLGDFVKGKDLASFDNEVAFGIKMHRAIDEFTDSHEIVHRSKSHLREKYNHYSGVIVDMFYDHFLGVNWKKYSDQSLEGFASHCYSTLEKHRAILPKKVLYMLPFMKENNWLVNYSKIEGLNKALTGMARRTSFDSKMEQATGDLKIHYDSFNQEFQLFYPALIEFADKYREQFNDD